MDVPATGWKNKVGTADRGCKCGAWSSHWVRFSNKPWPATCSVNGCSSQATLGAHVINTTVAGEKIVPMCDSCNKLSGIFTLKGLIALANANKSETCGI